ncbi:MAG: tRNA pseudouridine(55) synthase TruB [Synergistaceae bacterium]|nr:tRNA pseudouridine(55) synthase TruB [Synergistaceae bacterium]
MNALVLINKPVNIRSSQCVAMVKKQLYGERVGHSGTLDSTASGLLILLTGKATRLSDYIMSLPKVYRAVIQFGAETDTCDYSGEFIESKVFANLDDKILLDSLYKFSGWRMQSPPAISAVKIDGQPAYKLARSGQNPEMRARPVFFRGINIISPYNYESGTIELEISCGRGTYIRSLAHDLGQITGCGAYIKSLVRTSTGNFTLDKANNLDDKFTFTPLTELAKNYTSIYISERDSKSFLNGMSILIRNYQKISRGLSVMRDNIICVESDSFMGFGIYAGYDYIRPLVSVMKE